MSAEIVLTGGCQCGEVRYEARAASDEAYYCHCRMCQRAVGNIFATFINVKKRNVAWSKGTPATYSATPFAERSFCARCGTPLAFAYFESENIDLTVGSLDEPGRLRPTSHCGIESRIASFYRDDGLPGVRVDEIPHIVAKWKAAFGSEAMPGHTAK